MKASSIYSEEFGIFFIFIYFCHFLYFLWKVVLLKRSLRAKNDDGIKALYKIHNRAFARGFGHLNYEYLKSEWNDNLKLIVPFYDSFIATNLTSFSNCIPDFSFCNPVFFIEDNGLLLDEVILPSVQKYCADNKYETEKITKWMK